MPTEGVSIDDPAPATGLTPRQHARQARTDHAGASRWVGTLFCAAEFCNTVLAEVFADEANMTYLQPIGGRRVRHTAIPCPQCDKVRVFDTANVGPPPKDVLLQPPQPRV